MIGKHIYLTLLITSNLTQELIIVSRLQKELEREREARIAAQDEALREREACIAAQDEALRERELRIAAEQG